MKNAKIHNRNQRFYKNFQELALYETEGKDFEIKYLFRDSGILLMAIHGGRIEPYTDRLAEIIAGDQFSYYLFKGIKKQENRWLHLASHCFDEPGAVKAVRHADMVITVHGTKEKENAFIMIGGAASVLCRKLEKNLKSAGFSVIPPTERMAGIHPKNICNQGKSGKGIQLELSYKLREMLMRDIQKQKCFADVIRFVISGI